MNLITDTLLVYWQTGRRTKKTPSGWMTGNAPCCQDNRSRGGFITNNDGGLSYHCFNCGFKASWQPGRHISKRMKDFMRFLNMSDSEISKLTLEAYRVEGSELEQIETLIPTFDTKTLPYNAKPITSYLDNIPEKLIPILEYMDSRNLCLDDYPFYWSSHVNYNLRLIIPYYYENRLVGYTARSVDPKHGPRYLSEQQAGFVFNLDRQTHDKKFIIVCEGPIDAISIDGCALLGSEISDKQNWLLKRFYKEIILVPDKDDKGSTTVEQAIELGWSVSMPEWPDGIKDVSDAVVKLGRLATLWLIIESRQSYALKIQLRAKQFFKEVEL